MKLNALERLNKASSQEKKKTAGKLGVDETTVND